MILMMVVNDELNGFSTVFTGVGVLMEILIGGDGVAVEGVST